MTQPDYSKYSIPELQEALSTVDEQKYPETKAAIEAELQKRKDSGEYERHIQERMLELDRREQGRRRLARAARPWVAGYLEASALLMLFGTSIQLSVELGRVAWAFWMIGILYAITVAVAGYGLVRDRRWGHGLAVTVIALQLVRLQSESLYFSLSSAISVYLYGVIPEGNFEFGVSAQINPGGLQVLVGDLPYATGAGINLFAIFLIWLLFAGRRPLPGEGSITEDRTKESAE